MPETDRFAAAYDLVLALLKHVSPQARLTEFLAEPPDHYTLRMDSPREIGKTLIVTRHTVDRAPVNRAARRSLELLLRSAVLRQRSDRAIAEAAETQRLAQACDECGEPITLRDPLVVRRARLLHRRCFARRAA